MLWINRITALSSGRCLLALFVLTSLVTLSTSESLSSYLTNAAKMHKARQISDCDSSMYVSSVCYHCANLNSNTFNHGIHEKCCGDDTRIRNMCTALFTEEPKRGGRDLWYY